MRAGWLRGEQSTTFTCRAGEILYLVIDVSVKSYDSGFWGAEGFGWKIDQHSAMPPFFTDRPLLLYRGDQWLAGPEPGV
jgi:hypothetical protein